MYDENNEYYREVVLDSGLVMKMIFRDKNGNRLPEPSKVKPDLPELVDFLNEIYSGAQKLPETES